jgi:hypothetical protein
MRTTTGRKTTPFLTQRKQQMTISQQLDFIAEKFASVETIPLAAAEKALSLLDRAPKEALEMLVARKVKFLWMPAKLRLHEMSGK